MVIIIDSFLNVIERKVFR